MALMSAELAALEANLAEVNLEPIYAWFYRALLSITNDKRKFRRTKGDKLRLPMSDSGTIRPWRAAQFLFRLRDGGYAKPFHAEGHRTVY